MEKYNWIGLLVSEQITSQKTTIYKFILSDDLTIRKAGSFPENCGICFPNFVFTEKRWYRQSVFRLNIRSKSGVRFPEQGGSKSQAPQGPSSSALW